MSRHPLREEDEERPCLNCNLDYSCEFCDGSGRLPANHDAELVIEVIPWPAAQSFLYQPVGYTAYDRLVTDDPKWGFAATQNLALAAARNWNKRTELRP